MQKNVMPWKRLLEFHKEIAMKSEDNFFSFETDDQHSERFSYLSNDAVCKMQIIDCGKTDILSNPRILSNADRKNTEYYVGGIFWYTNRPNTAGKWDKMVHPLFYKPFSIKKDINDQVGFEPEQAKWNISPMFYKLMDKKNIVCEKNLDDLLARMTEDAAKDSTRDDFPGKFTALLVAEFPELKKEFVANVPHKSENHWLVFAAPKESSSVIWLNLITDYSNLIKHIDENHEELGGLALFEKNQESVLEKVPVTPIVPLNENQLKVVEKVISGSKITAVSGPPGCGKSQVVLSILLNAWEKGQSALFASSNNQAVDVVRERMKQFENNVPIVVRCGSKKTSELQRTLSEMIRSVDYYNDHEYLAKSKKDIEQLEHSLENINELINSNLPQRIDEFSRAALGAYGKAGVYKEEWKREYALYHTRLKNLGVQGQIDDFVTDVHEPYCRWMELHDAYLHAIKKDKKEKERLNHKIEGLKSQSGRILEAAYEQYDGERMLTGKRLAEIQSWYTSYQSFLLDSVETDLLETEWNENYDDWKSAEDVADWIKKTESFLECYKVFLSRFSEIIDEMNRKKIKEDQAEFLLKESGIKPASTETIEILRSWTDLYNLFVLEPNRLGDRLPFSKKQKQNKQLTEYEATFVDVFGPDYLQKYAHNTVERRRYIATNGNSLFEEYASRTEYANYINQNSQVFEEQKNLNQKLNEIHCPELENIMDKTALQRKREDLEQRLRVAKAAKKVYEERDRRNSIIKRDRELKVKGSQLLYPLMSGIKTDSVMNQLFTFIKENLCEQLTAEQLKTARKIVFGHGVDVYLSELGKACTVWDDIEEAYRLIGEIKEENLYYDEWIKACPERLKQVFSGMLYQDVIATTERQKTQLDQLYSDWTEKGAKTISRLKAKENEERVRAWDYINKAIDLCPDNILPEKKETVLERIKEKGWNVAYIRNLFAKINRDGIRIKQETMKAALEEALLQQTISARMKKLREDHDVKAALSKLYMEYKRTNDVITKDVEEDYEKALKALPIWITTGQSPQSIPMKSGIFDILIIDEATQCTITSILPLIYRCKKLVVIGDMDQLPAINNISVSTEKFIADKYDVTQYLSELGHCGCNVYKSVLNVISKKKGTVVSLTDHYRSNPLIIGFSNYYVYKNRLTLKKRMGDIEQNAQLGVFGRNVAGVAHRKTKGDKWCNRQEAQEVIRLIRGFKAIPEYANFSMGVITPFKGQEELINELIGCEDDITDVFVSTVHKYQGDEKDIIIFSPVVAKDITPGAAAWVETPHNLINVAVTRAREAFYVVADFAVCRRQPGILGKLIQYTEKIELLRKTSLYELQLFGLMMLQGWKIEVHPVIRDIEVDFIVSLSGIRIVVEVDGQQHENQQEFDHNRDAMLAANGYGVLRITTREIEEMPFEVIERIRESLTYRDA